MKAHAWCMCLVLAVVTVSLGACQSSPNPADVGPRASLGATYVAVESIAMLTESLHAQGAISDTDKAEIKGQLLDALENLDLAERLIQAGEGEEATTRLLQVEAILTLLRDTLEARQ